MIGSIFNKMGRWRILIWVFCLVVASLFFPLGKILFLVSLSALAEVTIREKRPESWWKVIALIHVGCGMTALTQFSNKEIIFLAVIAISNDTAALYGGKIFVIYLGKAFKIFPKTSPNKTWAGTLLGILAGTLAGLLTAHYLDMGYVFYPWWLLFGSGFQSAIGTGGDWINSKFKRIYKIKDSGDDFWTGKLCYGHGGLYDVLDNFYLQSISFFLFKISFL